MKTNYFRTISLLSITVMMSAAFQACNKQAESMANEDATSRNSIDTRAVGVKTPKFTVYIETNDVNPLNAGEYYFCNSSPREEVVDHVILFASNIRGNATSAWLHHNPNQTHILNNVSTLVQPLQNKGIKVLLGLLGDHTGVGFANLNSDMIDSFAQQVATCVNTKGLDGVLLDDEYARYDLAPAGLPTPSSSILSSLILKLRELLPTKKIMVFWFGNYMQGISPAAINAIDYFHPDYGCHYPTSGIPASKWSKLTLLVTNQGGSVPDYDTIDNCSSSYSGYGEVMLFNLRPLGATTTIMNWFADNLWGRTVCWTGTVHPKNY